MGRKLKTYQTSLGFFDLAIAAPSMKAALEAWGADSNLFHQGVAKESDDPDVVSATMAKPGVILRRPVGSDGPFRAQTVRQRVRPQGKVSRDAEKAAAPQDRRQGGAPSRPGVRASREAARNRTAEGRGRQGEGTATSRAGDRQGASRSRQGKAGA